MHSIPTSGTTPRADASRASLARHARPLLGLDLESAVVRVAGPGFDGALALVVTTLERARDARTRPVEVLAASQATGAEHVVMTDYHGPDFLRTPSTDAARDLYAGAGVSPSDVDCAQIYDAFTPLVLLGLEEFGFCGAGEGGAFASEGHLEWPNGSLPCNTSGGGLSEAYVHGFNLMAEGVRQMRGTSTCQVEGAEVGLVTSGAGVPTSAMLLART